MENLRFAPHEVLITYEMHGVLRWNHSDGRRGSDPVPANLDDDSALDLAQAAFDRLGNARDFQFSIEDGFKPCRRCGTDTRYTSQYSGEPTCANCLGHTNQRQRARY